MTDFFKKYQTVFFVVGVAIIAFLLGTLRGNLYGITGGALSGAAGAASNNYSQICDISSLSDSDATGIVLADPLNLRVGYGLNYHIITTLDMCTVVKINGRSTDSLWLEVELPGNLGGWVYASYILANVNISSLEDTTGAGGEYTASGGSGSSPYVSIEISNFQAVAYVTAMAPNTSLTATLSPYGDASKGVVVANGQTDENGNATLTFAMPDKWPDGSDVESGTLSLVVTDGSITLNATLTYYTN